MGDVALKLRAGVRSGDNLLDFYVPIGVLHYDNIMGKCCKNKIRYILWRKIFDN